MLPCYTWRRRMASRFKRPETPARLGLTPLGGARRPVITTRLRIQCRHYGFPPRTFSAASPPRPPGPRAAGARGAEQAVHYAEPAAGLRSRPGHRGHRGGGGAPFDVVVLARGDHPADPRGWHAAMGPGPACPV